MLSNKFCEDKQITKFDVSYNKKTDTMAKTEITIPEENLQFYNHLIALMPEVERKGKSTPYTSLNGHMFSFLDKDGVMGLRLSKKDREGFIQDFKTGLMEQHGRIMKEYVKIPHDLLKDAQILKSYLKKSYDYIKTLKPKPTKK